MLSADGRDDKEVGEQVVFSNATAGKWRKRYAAKSIAGLTNAPRSEPPRTVGDDKVAELLRLTLETKPKDATHWSTRKMATITGICNERISFICRTFELSPHRAETFQLSTDPHLIEKVRDVVGLYMSLLQNGLVLGLDEKGQCQALELSQPILPMMSGAAERSSHDYFLHGTTALFAALDVKTGEVCPVQAAAYRTSTSRDLSIHVVVDNYSTHKTKAAREWLLRHPRWQLHFIPTHSGWLNQEERFFAKITLEIIRRASFTSVPPLRKAILAYIDSHNEYPTPFHWTAMADRIFEKIEGYCSKLGKQYPSSRDRSRNSARQSPWLHSLSCELEHEGDHCRSPEAIRSAAMARQDRWLLFPEIAERSDKNPIAPSRHLPRTWNSMAY